MDKPASRHWLRRIGQISLHLTGAAGVAFGAAFGAVQLWDRLQQDKADVYWAGYQEGLNRNLVRIDTAVFKAMDDSRDAAAAINAAKRERDAALIASIKATAQEDVLLVAKRFGQVLRCAADGECSRARVDERFAREICRFWNMTGPYLEYYRDTGQGVFDDLDLLVDYPHERNCREIERQPDPTVLAAG